MSAQQYSNWCMPIEDSRAVVQPQSAPNPNASAGSTMGAPALPVYPDGFWHGDEFPNAPAGSLAGSWEGQGQPRINHWGQPTWPAQGSQNSPASAAYFHNQMLSARPAYQNASPAYGGDASGNYGGGGGYYGRGGDLNFIDPHTGHAGQVSRMSLPFSLRNPCGPPFVGVPLNPNASAYLTKREGDLQQLVEDCVFAQWRKKFVVEPMKAMPRNGRVFQEMFSIALSSVTTPYNGANNLVGEFRVPHGMDGNLNRVVFDLPSCSNVNPGASQFFFRVALNSTLVRNLEGVHFLYGSLTNSPFIIPGYGIKLVSGQYVRVYFSVPNGSPLSGASGRITAGLFGYFWPRS